MNIDTIKKEFPIFDEKIQNNDLVYLDSANSSQKPKVVTDRINEFYTKQFSNVGRSVHYLAVAATNLYENTRTSVQKFINAKDKNEIVFTKGATEALNLVANTLGQNYLQEGDEVLITELEHHSNYVPWHFLRKSKNIKINFAEINEDGEVTLEEIEKKITSRTKVISITHLSNVTGAILPIKEITELAHSKGIIVVVDGCQGAPHLRLDMQDLDCDFYAISCHKMYGPTGLGILYGKKKWLEELPPYQGGGGMIKEVLLDLGQLVVDTGGENNFNVGESVNTGEGGETQTLICSGDGPQYTAVHHYENADGEWVDIDPHTQSIPAGYSAVSYLDRLIRFNENQSEIVVLNAKVVQEVASQFESIIKG